VPIQKALRRALKTTSKPKVTGRSAGRNVARVQDIAKAVAKESNRKMTMPYGQTRALFRARRLLLGLP
jgi:hypothetical protein